MATLDQINEEYKNGVAGATHLLLVGHSKTGKSDYVAQAARDGYTVFYIDNDNGFPTLRSQLKGDLAAQQRVHYFNPVNMFRFVENMLTSAVVRYSVKTRGDFVSGTASPEDQMVEIFPSLIPRNVIFSIDSWTSLAYSCMCDVAKKAEIELTDIDKYGREIYGPANFHLTQLAQLIQLSPFHSIVQAHSTWYERKEKPPGDTVKDTKEGAMIIRETIEIPISSSNPHGLTLGKFFNEIGYLGITKYDKYEIDFRPKANRVGGGTPNSAGNPRTTHSFKSLFGASPVVAENPDRPWVRSMTAAEFKEAMAARQSTRPKLLTATPAAAPVLGAKPASIMIGGLKIK